jgi:cysteinyl-tRNA synthetase
VSRASFGPACSAIRGRPESLTLDGVSIRLYDTATRQVRDFVPLEAGKVGIYLCGVTVQSEPHVGHVRSGVNFDVLRRFG